MTYKKMKNKMVTRFLAVAILTGVVGAIGVFGIIGTGKNAMQIYDHSESRVMAGSLTRALLHLEVSFQNAVLYRNYPERLQVEVANVQQYKMQVRELIDDLGPRLYSKTTTTEYATIVEQFELIDHLSEQLIPEIYAKDMEAINLLADDLSFLSASIQNASQNIFDHINITRENQLTANMQVSTIIVISLIVVSITAFLFSLFFGWIESEKLSRPIIKVANAADEIARGKVEVDLDVHSNDETAYLADSFRKMVQAMYRQSEILTNLADGDYSVMVDTRSDYDVTNQAIQKLILNANTAFRDIQTTSSHVAAASLEIAHSAQNLATGSSEQAAGIEDLSSTLSELKINTGLNAEKAEAASNANNYSSVVLDNGIQSMSEVLVAMQNIGESSQRISHIINVIEDIAFQTNILALNAAVEAARAGQHGKGFAVVADEVRNLAAKSAQAANETAGIIKDGTEIILEGNRLVERTSRQLEDAAERAKQSVALLDEVAVSSKEHAGQIEKVSARIDQIAAVVSANSVTSEQSATAAEEMSAQSTELDNIVKRFKIGRSTVSEPLQKIRQGETRPDFSHTAGDKYAITGFSID